MTKTIAHKPSDSYLTLRQDKVGGWNGEWHLALRDADFVFGLDSDEDGAITWKELRSQEGLLSAYAVSHLNVSDESNRAILKPTKLLVDIHSDGAYAVLRFTMEGLPKHSRSLDLEYRALFDLDPLHRGLLRLEAPGMTRLAVFSPTAPKQHFDLADRGRGQILASFVREGLWHIWTGYDHLLFLIALLLPSVLRRQVSSWEPQESLLPVLHAVLKTVSAFTVAHSITLTLAVLHLVQLPPRLVESAIAASVVVAALNNVISIFSERTWVVAFLFGLIHGFGFANSLVDLGLGNGTFALGLLGFNTGVEAGQLAVVCLFLLPAAVLRNTTFYQRQLMPIGSLAISILAGTWFIERVWDLKWLPF